MNYTTKDPLWTNEKGHQVELKRITPSERFNERKAIQVLKKAKAVNKYLVDFKALVIEVCGAVYKKYMEENNNGGKPSKGNFDWYNFDRSIKIQVSIAEPIKFDDLAIIACKDKLDEFFKQNVSAKTDVIKEMITDAFETSRGKLDTKKVLDVLSYKSRIDDPLFQEAMELIEKGIRRPKSKTYFRIWEKDETGQYQAINLNFSSI